MPADGVSALSEILDKRFVAGAVALLVTAVVVLFGALQRAHSSMREEVEKRVALAQRLEGLVTGLEPFIPVLAELTRYLHAVHPPAKRRSTRATETGKHAVV